HVFQVVGQMPENYFIYYEEMDWSEMVKRAGYRIAVDRSVTLYHKESQTVVRFNEMKSYLMTRNRLLFMRRNVRPFQLMIFWLFYLLVATPKQLWVYWRSHQWNNINAHIAGILWNLRSSANAPTIGYKFNHLGKI
ncbi:MAG TPA: glycosyltransferase family 2 protein, partial [Cyclobacteriaceae bacterium]|nr:glycosyltransferase family 2 protein [Cyclobacteriaceae bacterium]